MRCCLKSIRTAAEIQTQAVDLTAKQAAMAPAPETMPPYHAPRCAAPGERCDANAILSPTYGKANHARCNSAGSSFFDCWGRVGNAMEQKLLRRAVQLEPRHCAGRAAAAADCHAAIRSDGVVSDLFFPLGPGAAGAVPHAGGGTGRGGVCTGGRAGMGTGGRRRLAASGHHEGGRLERGAAGGKPFRGSDGGHRALSAGGMV